MLIKLLTIPTNKSCFINHSSPDQNFSVKSSNLLDSGW
nr:MAG TPA: hypothetical protein [Caudoviricetes sp.]